MSRNAHQSGLQLALRKHDGGLVEPLLLRDCVVERLSHEADHQTGHVLDRRREKSGVEHERQEGRNLGE